MASRSHSTHSARAFTLIEIVVVLALFVAIGGLSLIVSMDTFRSYTFKDERNLIVSALHKARSQAVSNMCFGSGCIDGKPHGVKVLTVGGVYHYVIFQGATYAGRTPAVDEVLVSDHPTTVLAGFEEVVFMPLSGNGSTSPRTLSVSETGGTNSSVITVGAEGQITWTR